MLATQNPIESEGTYPLPEAQVDRFMFKLVVDYPSHRDEVAVVERSLDGGAQAREVLSPEHLSAHQRAAATVYVDRRVMEYAVALTTATREPGEENWVEFGASPRGSINLIHAGRALALLRGRDYMLPVDVRDLARDVLRHRIVLTYEALAAGVDSDRVLDDVLERVPMPRIELAQERPYGARDVPGPAPARPAGGRAAGGGRSTRSQQRRARKFAVRYTNVDLLAAVAGRSWTRHLPAAAGAAGAGRAADRARAAAADGRRRAPRGDGHARLRHVGLDARHRRPAVAAGRRAGGGQRVRRRRCRTSSGSASSASARAAQQLSEPTTDHARVKATIDSLQVAGATAMGDALKLAINSARVPIPDGLGGERRLPAAIVLLGDGASHARRRTRSTSSSRPRSTRSRSTPSRWAPRTARSPTPTRTRARSTPSACRRTC